jgi:hypothetical protein
MIPTLGADPGTREGAASLLEGDDVRRWWTWCLMTRKSETVYRVSRSHGGKVEVPSMFAVGWCIAEDLPSRYELAVEGLFVAKMRRKKRHESMEQYMAFIKRTLAKQQAAIPLAESAGMLIGGLGQEPVARPTSNDWRWSQLRLRNNVAADKAEAYAVQMAPRRFRWPDAPDPLTKKERGACAESAFIAAHVRSTRKIRNSP